MYYLSRQYGRTYYSIIRSLEISKDRKLPALIVCMDGSVIIPYWLLTQVQDAIMGKQLMPRLNDIKNFVSSKLN